MLRIIPTLAAILMFSTAFAEEPTELITDRPDQTESAETISPGSVQTELGIGDASSSDSSFTGLVRIGLHNKIELRVGLDEWFLSGSDDALDFSLGAKFRFLEEEGRRPAMSAIVAVNSTTNDDSDKTLPSFRMIFAQTINDRLSLGYNAGVSWVDENGDLSSRFLWTVALGIEGTETVGFFVEAFGDTGLSDHGPVETSLDGGVTWLLRENLQLDFTIGAGLSSAAPDWLAAVGVSFRLPG